MTGEMFFNGDDAFTTYGVIMGNGCFAALVCPAPAKGYITNDVRADHGREYLTDASRLDERNVVLNIYIKASNYADLYAKLALLANNVFANGEITITTKYQSNVVYHMVYKGCQQLTQLNGRLARFQLQLVEPNPAYRSNAASYTGAMDTFATELPTEE